MAVDTKYTTVESGWQRFNSTNLNIKYDSSFVLGSSGIYGSDSLGAEIVFYVYTSNIRILDDKTSSNRSNNINVNIDDLISEYYSARGTTTGNDFTCVYEKLNLEKSIHKIKIINGSTDSLVRIGLQCIDIDEDGYMCTPDGRYIDVTPIMTSNTTPDGYVASASSIYTGSTLYSPYRLFDGINSVKSTGWASKSGLITNQWIQLKGIDKFISDVLITTTYNGQKEAPYRFDIQGSNNGTEWSIIKSFNNINDWKTEFDTKLFNLNSINKYNYYRIYIYKTNGSASNGVCSMGELRYLLSVDTPFYLIQDNVDNKIYNYDKENNILVEVTDTSILNMDALNNTCIYDLSKVIPLLDGLSDDLTILSNNDKKVVAQGIKSNLELIVSKQTLSANIAHLIRELEVICTLVGNGNIKVVVSRDKGSTWSYWDTTTSAWLNLANTVTKRDYNSMTDGEKEKWEALKQEAWQYGMTPDVIKIADFESIKDNGFKFAFVLSRPTYEDNAALKEIDWTYDEDGGYIVLNNTDILIKKTDKYIKLVPQRNMENIKVEIVN